MMAGMALAFAGYFGGFAAFLLVADVLAALCAMTAEAERSAAPYTAYTRLRIGAVPHRTPRVR
ncbi:hypothetical protein [Streptomyces sp. NPDC004014]